ncbi:MAG: IS110 family transposase [Actinobacteria bacterium]|nr:IS110 family transposase [Actinomycetota bacterium]
MVLASRVLVEFGDDTNRYATGKARRNYAGTSPIIRASGRKTAVLARNARNRRLGDALFSKPSRADHLTRRTRLLRRHAHPGHRPPRCLTTTSQPSGRHLARLLTTPHPLRRGHRLAPPRQDHQQPALDSLRPWDV